MFARQYRSWCILVKSVNRIAEPAVTFPKKVISSTSSLHNNLFTVSNGASDKNYRGRDRYPISVSIGLSGLLSVLSNGKDEDENKKPLSGELKIIEMIKLAKLSQEVFTFEMQST